MLQPKPSFSPRRLQDHRRAGIVFGMFMGFYGLLLTAVWGIRVLPERAQASVPGSLSRQELQRRSAPICRLFNGPPAPDQWRFTYHVSGLRSGQIRRLWDVDCSDEGDISENSVGVLIRWDADTGDLLYISNHGTSLLPALSSPPQPPTSAEIVAASRNWLNRLQLDLPDDPWVLAAPPTTSPSSPIHVVRWRRRGGTCVMKLLLGKSGDLLQLWLLAPERPG